jgi:hypothetical protein
MKTDMMRNLWITCLCLITITTNAARVVDGINYEFDRDNKLAYVIAADESAPYSGDIIIPEKVVIGNNEFTVVAIKKSAFKDNDKITSLSLPETIVEIGEYAFRGCTKLTSLYLPDGLTKIGEAAFSYCRNVENLRLPDNSEIVLGVNAFSNLDLLQKLEIPDSWTSLGERKIDGRLFEKCGITELKIGKNLKYIGMSCFNGCSELSNIICSEDGALEEIGTRAFAYCTSLLNLKFLPKTVKIIGECAFTGCSNLREVSIPNHVEKIIVGSWQNLYTGKLIFEDGTTPIIYNTDNTGVAGDLFSPVTLYLGRPIDTENSKGMPFGTSELMNLTFGPYFKGGKGLKFGKNVKIIYSYVEDPSTVTCEFETNVYDNAILYVPVGHLDEYMAQANFSQFFDVREFMPGIPVDNIEFEDIITKNVCLNEWDTDYDCELSYKEAEAVTDIGKVFNSSYITTFNEFKNFKGLKTIPERAFNYCKYLESIDLPYTITSIGDYAFSSCTKLNKIVISYNVSSIGECAFYNCKKLSTLIIPSSVKTIGEEAFYECESLTEVYCLAKKVPETTSRTFNDATMKQATLYVQKGCKNIYKATAPWMYFKEIVEINGGGEEIIPGDANGDGVVDVADVVAIVNYILNKPGENFNEQAADVNGDGVIDVADVVAVVNIILKGGNANSPEAKAHARAYLKAHGFIVP